MNEYGKITSVNGKTVTVRIDKKGECEKCGMCGMKKNEPFIDLKAVNNTEKPLSAGDGVIIEINPKSSVLSIVLAFLVPVALIGLTLLITLSLKISELVILLTCLGIMFLWYAILGVIDKKLAKLKSFTPEIVSIISEEKGEENE